MGIMSVIRRIYNLTNRGSKFLSRALSISGIIAALGVGMIYYFLGGLFYFVVLITFFITSSALTRVGANEKEKTEKQLYEKTGTRDYEQVLANGGPAALAVILHWLYPSEILTVAFCAAMAACNADTWASEIGILSRRKPFSLLSRKEVQKGMSGGVTGLGLGASLAGSAVISLVYAVGRYDPSDAGTRAVYVLVILVSGFLGSVIDSILGDTLQVKYLSAETGRLTEKRKSGGRINMRIKGLAHMNNDAVNFLSSAFSALLALLLAAFLT